MMTDISPLPAELQGASRLWLGQVGTGLQVRLFRKTFDLAVLPSRATLAIYAEFRFHLWFNGHYITRGPVFHPPNRLPLGLIDLTGKTVIGANTLAVLVASPNMGLHNGVPLGEPGVIARFNADFMDGSHLAIPTDATWRATHKTGWRSDTPKAGWALPPIEVYDAGVGPDRWWSPSFDDSDWLEPDAHLPVSRTCPGATWFTPPVPGLIHRWETTGFYPKLSATHGTVHVISSEDPTSAFGAALDEQPRDFEARHSVKLTVDPDSPGELLLEGLTPDRGAIVTGDLGCEVVGTVGITVDCPSAGVIDLAWTERRLDGKLRVCLKNVSYASRVIARPGIQSFDTIGISGFRYLVVTFREFDGAKRPLRILRLGATTSQPDLQWQGRFKCDDERINQVWNMCVRSLQVGTQEAVMDCPTREQAPYIGDGNPVAHWIGLLTGDYGHWKFLVRETFARQSPDGFLRSAVFTGNVVTLIDYNLIAVISVRDYLRATADSRTAADVLEGCRRVLRWFLENASDPRFPALFSLNAREFDKTYPWEHRYDPATDANATWSPILFIDHPGTGWHNVDEPGIDRTGVNVAINALLVVALRAMAELERAVGDPSLAGEWTLRADRIAATGATLLDQTRKVFPDGFADGKALAQISQQTNTWAVWAGFTMPELGADILKRLHTSDDPALARSGPYFWLYTLPLLAKHGLHEIGLSAIRHRWGRMLDHDATTLWETFSGDHLDSWCHPWGAAPVPFLLEHVLGFDLGNPRSTRWTIRPRPDLLSRASGAYQSAHGLVSIEWETHGAKVHLRGHLPARCQAALVLPDGEVSHEIQDNWFLIVPGVGF